VRIGVPFMAKTKKAQPYCKTLQYREAIGNAGDSNFLNLFCENCRQGGRGWSISIDTPTGNAGRKGEKKCFNLTKLVAGTLETGRSALQGAE
jgi:hypothetical protein